MFQRFTAGVVGFVLSAAMAAAQVISVPTSVTVGEEISIGYTDASRAGQTIVVNINVSTPSLVPYEVVIHLDKNGRGSSPWTVPVGSGATFNAPGARQVTRAF